MNRPSRKELGLDSDGQIIELADRKANNWQQDDVKARLFQLRLGDLNYDKVLAVG